MGPVEELRARLDPADPADAAAAGELDVIHRNGLRLGKLVNTLLDFSRIEAGRMQASFEPLDTGPSPPNWPACSSRPSTGRGCATRWTARR
jgi:signal transduction histidine kinase